MNANNKTQQPTADTSSWFNFFQQCNLPDTIAHNYTILFTNNRMQFDMLNELNKELLHEIGICAIGDVLSILKHVKEMSKNPVATNNLVIKRDSFKAETNFIVPSKRIIQENNVQIKKDNPDLSSNLLSRLKFKNDDNGNKMEVHNDDDDDDNNLSIKTDITGKRIVIKTNNNNNNDLSKNQSKLLNLKKPIIKRKVNNISTFVANNDEKQQQQGQVALKLLGEFIKKPQNDAKQKPQNDRPILSRLKF